MSGCSMVELVYYLVIGGLAHSTYLPEAGLNSVAALHFGRRHVRRTTKTFLRAVKMGYDMFSPVWSI